MRNKELEKQLKKETEQLFVSNKMAIYEKLGIAFSDEKKVLSSLETQIKKEADVFVPNKKTEIMESVKANEIKNTSTIYVEQRLMDESDEFVPSVKKQVFKNINKKEKFSFANFFFKPLPLAITSALLIGVISTTVVLIKPNNGTTEDSTIIEKSAKNTSNVSFKITSASELYSPEILFTLPSDQKINIAKIAAVNDESIHIMSYFNEDGSIKKEINQLDVKEFSKRYLSIALNLGYVERKDINKENKITIYINSSSEDYEFYNEAKDEIIETIYDFAYENKIVANVSCQIGGTSSNDIDPNLEALILQAYNLATKLFVDSNGNTISVLCFSTSYEDWINKYKNTTIEEMEDYVEYLLDIQNKISSEDNKDLFLKALSECSLYQNSTKELVNRYDILKSKYDLLEDFVEENFDFELDEIPSLDDDYWDWWEDYGHMNGFQGGHNHGWEKPENGFYSYDYTSLEDCAKFIDSFDKEVFDFNNNIDFKSALSLCTKMVNYANTIINFNESFTFIADTIFEAIMKDIDEGHYNGNHDYGNHYEDEPDDWDDDYESWWNDHGHHHGGK